ncbi:dCTP pyrophosphatase 1 [Porphyridium purpureum]|uniref:dCTP pyrophosphatase 1 n=1 Tax=Porphyridium purpureum TaxID=35688 RepID=A0A5J4YZL8_PORPP|nr:dCTP pyrophosphatase 1 [Porphyridium purpureum]|eukprot:POR4828..scf208_2
MDSDSTPPCAPSWGEYSLQHVRESAEAFSAEREWEQFHTPRNLLLALVGEVGELAELFQWKGDAGCGPGLPGWSDAEREHLGEEMSDVLIYLIRLADRCGVSLAEAVRLKFEKNALKYPAEHARGSAAKYTQLAVSEPKTNS